MSEEFEPRSPDRTGPLWASQSWLHADTLRSLAEVNDECLQLICEQARAGTNVLRSWCEAPAHCPSGAAAAPPAMLVELRPSWCGLDVGARRRAAHCPYLLVDAGFTETRRWTWVHERHIQDRDGAVPPAPFFTVPQTIAVMRLVMTYAWHLARSQNAAARLLLGMSARCAELIATCTLNQVTQLAESHPHWLQPRWPDRLPVWRELLFSASSGEPAALERIHMRGVQLLAAEVRSGGNM